jgi:hypothetical protein
MTGDNRPKNGITPCRTTHHDCQFVLWRQAGRHRQSKPVDSRGVQWYGDAPRVNQDFRQLGRCAEGQQLFKQRECGCLCEVFREASYDVCPILGHAKRSHSRSLPRINAAGGPTVDGF